MTDKNYVKLLRNLRGLRVDLGVQHFDDTQLQELYNIFGNIARDVSERIVARTIKEKYDCEGHK